MDFILRSGIRIPNDGGSTDQVPSHKGDVRVYGS